MHRASTAAHRARGVGLPWEPVHQHAGSPPCVLRSTEPEQELRSAGASLLLADVVWPPFKVPRVTCITCNVPGAVCSAMGCRLSSLKAHVRSTVSPRSLAPSSSSRTWGRHARPAAAWVCMPRVTMHTYQHI